MATMREKLIEIGAKVIRHGPRIGQWIELPITESA